MALLTSKRLTARVSGAQLVGCMRRLGSTGFRRGDAAFTLWSNSSCKAEAWPQLAALCKGVQPNSSHALGSAWCFSKAATVGTSPKRAAKDKGVWPWRSACSTVKIKCRKEYKGLGRTGREGYEDDIVRGGCSAAVVQMYSCTATQRRVPWHRKKNTG